jgi:hypothetical protein
MGVKKNMMAWPTTLEVSPYVLRFLQGDSSMQMYATAFRHHPLTVMQ